MNTLHETENEQYIERYHLAMERIKQIPAELEDANCLVPSFLRDYFQKTADFILYIDKTYQEIQEGMTLSHSELVTRNEMLYADILPNHYPSSYCNPTYAMKQLGKELGTPLCVLFTELRSTISYAFEGHLFYLTIAFELYLEIYNLFENEDTTADNVIQAIYYYASDYADITIPDRTKTMLVPAASYMTDFILSTDYSNSDYLYQTGEYISENEVQIANYLSSLPEEDIEKMAFTFTEGFRKGFEVYRMDLSKKKTVNIRYYVGFERIVAAAIRQFKKMGLSTTIYRGNVGLIHKNPNGQVGFISIGANRQFDYDHRMDEALIMDKAYIERKLTELRISYETHKKEAAVFAGPAVMEIFGEEPFAPITNPEALSYHPSQRTLRKKYQSESSILSNEFIPADERSFTIISYPVPSIGKDFKEIFNETIRVNTLDSEKYLTVQSAIIDALDQGSHVQITGRNGNHTDLTVALQPLKDLKTQTGFENCLADVNIPLGEVFTSPQLEGTNGILHVTSVYLEGLEYKDLEIEFKDGCTKHYSCKNFETEEENKKFIEENVLFHHDSLPMGEFAIGTNTTAYAMGKKFNISKALPILIAEKTGPHFAVGDTCFSREEDMHTYNPDGKEMIAKENTFSRLRNEAPEKAYFNCHTDITIPYNELGDIVIKNNDGTETYLIHDGRFVLPGTEELNIPLE